MNRRGIVLVAWRFGCSWLRIALLTSLLAVCWGVMLGSPCAASTVLGPSAYPAARQAMRSRAAVIPNVVNLTNTVSVGADARDPAWSPDGNQIAFTCNGQDVNQVGHIDAVTLGQRYLFVMNPDGSGLRQYALSAGTIQSLAWCPTPLASPVIVNGQTYRYGLFAVVCGTDGSYAVRYYSDPTADPVQIYPTDTTQPQFQTIGAIAASNAGNALYFEMATGANWNIYVLMLKFANGVPGVDAGNPTPRRLTNAQGNTDGNNRHPYPANNGTDLLFDSDRDGNWRVYRMDTGGTNVRPITADTTDDDTQARPTADGRIVFTSTRLTGSGDYTYNKNIWLMPLGQEGTGNPPVQPEPRFFTSITNISNQYAAAPQVVAGRADEILFVSNSTMDPFGNRHDDIYLASLVDNQPPYIVSPPTIAPKVTTPGGVVTITVQVANPYSGIRHVWAQLKDPNTAVLDSQGQEHVISQTAASGDERQPLEFTPYDLQAGGFLDPSLASSDPGYNAAAGSTRLFPNEGAGYPEVPEHWVEMYDDGTHGDATAGDGIYTVMLQTPQVSSDWYVDIIVEDTVNKFVDSHLAWHGNRRRFDNIGGCSTMVFTGGKKILFVDDFVDGQRLLSMGLPPVTSTYDPPVFPNGLYYFNDGSPFGPDQTTPATPATTFGGADIWRVLCRGRVPYSILQTYLPTPTLQVSPLDGQTPISVQHGGKMVVWVSPSSWFHLLAPQTGGDGSGSLIESSVQNDVENFVHAGGRLFVIGSDLLTGLTAGNTSTDAFMSDVLGVRYDNSTVSIVAGQDQVVPANGWYGSTLSQTRLTTSMTRNTNPSQYVVASPQGAQLCWDTCLPTNGGMTAFTVGAPTAAGFSRGSRKAPLTRATTTTTGVESVGVSREDSTSNGRTVFWSFGYEHLSINNRAKAAADTVEWLLDGSISGTVAQINSLQPIANALVTVSEAKVTTTTTTTTGTTNATNTVTVTTATGSTTYTRGKDMFAVRTNARGEYLIQGLRPGKQYMLYVSPNGYLGTSLQVAPAVVGGLVAPSVGFLFNRNVDTCTLTGQVTRNGVPVASATVKATPLSGAQAAVPSVTDASGHYTLANLPTGPYTVTAVHPVTGETAQVTVMPGLSAGESRNADIQFGLNAPQPGVLSGLVSGNNQPIPGASVQAKQGTSTYSTTTGIDGTFSFTQLVAGSVTLSFSAPGFVNASQTIATYDPAVGMILQTVVMTATGTQSSTYAVVSGQVFDGNTSNALAGATVTLLVAGTAYTTMQSAGTFQTGAAPYNFYFSIPSGAYSLQVTKAGCRTPATVSLNLAPGDAVTNLVFNLQPVLALGSGVTLFSLPGNYQGMTITDMLGMPAGDAALLYNRIATDYDNSAKTYTQYTAATAFTIRPGHAYWAKLGTTRTVQVEGKAVDATQPFALPLQAGWNLIGNPFPFTVDLYDCQVQGPAGTQTWSAAQTLNLVGGAVYGWAAGWGSSGGSYTLTTLLAPYQGYWLYANQACTLLIANISSARRTETTRVRQAASLANWQVRMEVHCGGSADTANNFGISAQSRGGFDNLRDYRKPPASPSDSAVSLCFPHRDWGANSGDFATDIQTPGSGEMHWSLRVDATQPDADVVVSWPEFAAQLPSGYQAVLTDLDGGQTCYMNTNKQYVFHTGSTAASRNFALVVSPKSAGVAVTNVHGEMNGRFAGIAFSLSAAATAEISIRSLTGRLIAGTEITAVAGANNWAWNGKDQSGRMTPPGIYLCDVKASDATGRSARGTGMMYLGTHKN